MKDINLNLFKYFYEVVNTKNITKASENLFVSQPAVTKAINDLEKETNTKLLRRSKKGVIPTKEGEILYEYINNMFKSLNSTLNTIDQSEASLVDLNIGATTTNFIVFIKKPLKAFKKLYPNVKINIILETKEVLENRIKLNKLDIVIKNGYENILDFTKIKSFQIQDKFITSSQYFNHLKNKVLSLDDILNEPLVLLDNITHSRRNFESFLKEKNKSIKPAYEFNSYSLCRELIKDGFGIGIGNPIHYENNKDYSILNTDFNLPIRNFDIGYIKSSTNKYINKFIELL